VARLAENSWHTFAENRWITFGRILTTVSNDLRQYRLIAGNLRHLPSLTLADILPILQNQDTTTQKTTLRIPPRALALLNGGDALKCYASRSEVAQSIIASLVNAGFDDPAIVNVFQKYKQGKFAELYTRNARKAEEWLRRSITEARRFCEAHNSPARQRALEALAWLESTPMSGAGARTDRAILAAHFSIAARAARAEWGASVRTLAELAGVNRDTASNSNQRLCADDFLQLVRPGGGDCASLFTYGSQIAEDRKEAEKNAPPSSSSSAAAAFAAEVDKPRHTLSTSSVRKCPTLSIHDAFRYRGLGKTGGEVYASLQDTPATVKELAQVTGAHKKTVKRVLVRMSKIVDGMTGEVLQMVECDDSGRWQALDVDLELVARVIGTAGTGERQRATHALERQKQQRYLTERSLNYDKTRQFKTIER
jgi:DNA-binding transcriptional regulator YhcF (GntR family)